MSSTPKLLLLPVLTGILCFASFPKVNQGYLAWFALIPLVTFVYQAKGTMMAFVGGFLAGTLQFIGLLIWIPAVLIQYGDVPAALAWLLFVFLAAIQGIYPGIACALTRLLMNRFGEVSLLVLTPAWVATEYVRTFLIFGGFPWLQMGYSQTQYLAVVQIADLTGVYGVSFLIVLINTALAWILQGRFRRKTPFFALIGALALVMACLWYGRSAIQRWEKISPDMGVAMLQGNISFDDPESVLRWKFKDGYLQMASDLNPGTADLIVLPESPSPLSFQFDKSYRETLQELARRFRLGLIFNNIRYSDTEGEVHYFNSAHFLNSEGLLVGSYDKLHLVPFGEYIPLRKIFFFADTISRDIADFSPGEKYQIFSAGPNSFNLIICFEAVFPALVRVFVERGSGLIINLTNDGWYGASAAPYQHLAMARWRAVENRRYFIRATNSGISTVIEPTGRLQVSTALLQREVCVGRFSFLSEQTFYTRHGDLFAIACAIIALTALILYGVQVKHRGALARER